ncbi:MAG TPA: YajQ family cyclic di-GMP-binding protein [Bacteroidetes bacterium]|nr:YajQ family cyclic di-GMP-binding protein [Bacteroidota bacterium]
MPSFDIVSKADTQLLDNAINTARKEIVNRYDFHGTQTEIDFDKKENLIKVTTENDLRLKHIIDILISRAMKQHIDARCFDFGKEQYASGNMVKKEIKIKQGLDRDTAKKVVKEIKDSGLKVQPGIMDDLVRVTGKKIDDLQSIIALMRSKDFGVPLQFVNMK